MLPRCLKEGWRRPVPAHNMAGPDPARRRRRAAACQSCAAAGQPSSGSRCSPIPIHPAGSLGLRLHLRDERAFRDAEHGTREGMYAYVYREPRPEIFFKGTARVCVARGSRSAFAAIRSSRRPSRSWRWSWGAGEDRRLHDGQRRLGVGHRARERAVPAAVEGLHGVLRARSGDRDAGRI